MKVRTLIMSLGLGLSCLISACHLKPTQVPSYDEDSVSEQIILDDILAEIDLPKLSRHIRIMERFGKFYLAPREATEEKFVASKTDKTTGFVCFARSPDRPVYYNTQPSKKEIKAPLSLVGAKNSTALACFGVLPQQEIEEASVSVSDLKNHKGETLLSQDMDLYRVQHLMESVSGSLFQPHPIGYRPFRPGEKVPLHPGITYGFAVDIPLDGDVAPGTYRGTVTIHADGKEMVKPIMLQVHDFELLQPDTETMNWGFWYAGLEKNKDDQKATQKDLDFMARFGVTFLVLPASLDADYFEYIQTIRKAGINGTLFIDFVLLERDITHPDALFGNEEWNTEYESLVKQFVDQMRLIGEDETSYVAMIADEPRETMLEPWNRTYAQTMVYHKAIGNVAPSLRRAVNPMEDLISEEFPNGLYTEFNKTFEILMPHYWARCRNTLDAVRSNPKCELWSYNDGSNRLAWGLNAWKIGIKGRGLWRFRPYTELEHPLSPVSIQTVHTPGSFTGGPSFAINWPDEIWPNNKMMNLREGITDYRYVYTLEQAIQRASTWKQRRRAKKAVRYLKNLKKEIPEYAHSSKYSDATNADAGDSDAEIVRHLDNVRREIAQHIVKLR